MVALSILFREIISSLVFRKSFLCEVSLCKENVRLQHATENSNRSPRSQVFVCEHFKHPGICGTYRFENRSLLDIPHHLNRDDL